MQRFEISARIHVLLDKPADTTKNYVLYWMQASERTRGNHALEYAIKQANELGLPTVVCFGLMDDYPEANERHYAFLLQGLRDVSANLHQRDIAFVVRHGAPADAAVHYGKDAALVVCDRGYTNHQKRWRDEVADKAKCRVVEVESDIVVPVEVVSNKHEYAARTIRPRIHKQWERFLKPLAATKAKHSSLRLKITGNIDASDPDAALKKLKLDRSVKAVDTFIGGEDAADQLIEQFIATKLKNYKEGRNEPADAQSSVMSPYLHFGQVSPVELALRVRVARQGGEEDRASYLEELIIRRELSMNFCWFEPKYDRYAALPEWARKTLAEHKADKREYVYTRKQLEHAETHDIYWNAAQLQMTLSGFMHNYMRMYWGKKFIEWIEDPEEAFDTLLAINNKYFFDGRDPNSFANVAWVFGTHDRPWGPKRKIFGTVRYMNAAGLDRKFDMQRYVAAVWDLAKKNGVDASEALREK